MRKPLQNISLRRGRRELSLIAPAPGTRLIVEKVARRLTGLPWSVVPHRDPVAWCRGQRPGDPEKR